MLITQAAYGNQVFTVEDISWIKQGPSWRNNANLPLDESESASSQTADCERERELVPVFGHPYSRHRQSQMATTPVPS
jgi:hypothetical protein